MYFSVTCSILKLKPYVGVKRDDDDDDDDDNDNDVAVEDDDDELNHLFLLRNAQTKKSNLGVFI